MSTSSSLSSPVVRRLLTQLQTAGASQSGGRRNEILEAAEALLRERGLDGFTLRRLADRVGIKLASLQYHFPSKGLLMEALFERSAEVYQQDLVRLLRDLGDHQPQAVFEAVIDWMCEVSNEGGNLDFQLWALAAHDPIANAALDRYMAAYRELLAELMKPLNPKQKAPTRLRRAALISTMIEGRLLIIGEGRLPHKELSGLAKETRRAALLLALSD